MVSLVEPFAKEGNSVRRQSPNARLEVSNAALDGGASLLSPTQPPAQKSLPPGHEPLWGGAWLGESGLPPGHEPFRGGA